MSRRMRTAGSKPLCIEQLETRVLLSAMIPISRDSGHAEFELSSDDSRGPSAVFDSENRFVESRQQTNNSALRPPLDNLASQTYIPVAAQVRAEPTTNVSTAPRATQVSIDIPTQRQSTNAVPFDSSSINDTSADFEEESAKSETNRYGGIIGFDDQPLPQDTLPPTNRDGQATRGWIQEATIAQDVESESFLDSDGQFETLDSDLPGKSGKDKDSEAEITPSSTGDTKSAPDRAVAATSTPYQAANDLAFAEYDNIEEFGGLIDFACDAAMECLLEEDIFPSPFSAKAALQVDTIIGQAPLLEVDELSIADEAAKEPTAERVHPAAASSAAIAILPWRVNRRQQNSRRASAREFNVESTDW